MLIGRVIDDKVDEHADAALLRTVGEIDEIAERAIAVIDAIVVRHVVPVVTMRRGLERHQPNGCDAQAMEIVQASLQPAEVANAIAIGIHVGADRQAIDDGVLVPKVTDHAAPLSCLWHFR